MHDLHHPPQLAHHTERDLILWPRISLKYKVQDRGMKSREGEHSFCAQHLSRNTYQRSAAPVLCQESKFLALRGHIRIRNHPCMFADVVMCPVQADTHWPRSSALVKARSHMIVKVNKQKVTLHNAPSQWHNRHKGERQHLSFTAPGQILVTMSWGESSYQRTMARTFPCEILKE